MLNIYAIIILIALLANYILNLIADILNFSHLSGELPKEFEKVFNPEEYKKSQQYERVKTKFRWIVSAVNLIVLLVFWFLGGFNYLDIMIRSLDLSLLATGILYIGILSIASGIINIPFKAYFTFVIEEKFGFNKMTVKTFIADALRSLLLFVVLGIPILVAILAFFEHAGAMAWLYVWIIVAVFILFTRFISPTLIAPLYYKFRPLDQGELRDAVMNYAHKIDYPLKDIYVVDGSRRSAHTNAFFVGFGKNKRIALFDTLIKRHTTQELVSVLAHEVGHYKKKHIPLQTLLPVLQMGVLFYLLSIFVSHQGLFDVFLMQNVSIYAGLVFFMMLFTPVQMVLSVVTNIISRKHEYEADAYAKETANYKHKIEALKKVALHNLANLRPHPFYIFLNHSHPPILKRIQALRDR